jgi:predicted nucleic acid-binding protein
MKPKAILDTSFWIHLVKLDLENKFMNLFEIIMPKKVEDEILYSNSFKFMIYKPQDIRVYENLKSHNKITILNPKEIDKKISSQISKNSGELYAIALAKEKNWVVFIDNGRPQKYCFENNIQTGTIIDFLIHLKNENIIGSKEIEKKIELIKNSLSKKYLDQIKKYLLVKK